jgi:hypothetical protein
MGEQLDREGGKVTWPPRGAQRDEQGRLTPRPNVSRRPAVVKPYVAALALAVTVVGLVAAAVVGWKRRIKYFAQQRRRLHVRREQKGLLQQAKVEGEPPMPFHVRQGNGPLSTAAADNLFVALRRAFRDRRKGI